LKLIISRGLRYDVIEEYDSLILKLGYILTSDRAYTSKLLEDVTNNNNELYQVSDGMEFLHSQLMEELKNISTKLTDIMRG
jgi:hypothetical protein